MNYCRWSINLLQIWIPSLMLFTCRFESQTETLCVCLCTYAPCLSVSGRLTYSSCIQAFFIYILLPFKNNKCFISYLRTFLSILFLSFYSHMPSLQLALLMLFIINNTHTNKTNRNNILSLHLPLFCLSVCLSGLADIMKRLMTKYDNLFEISFPYSMGWHGKTRVRGLKRKQSLNNLFKVDFVKWQKEGGTDGGED